VRPWVSEKTRAEKTIKKTVTKKDTTQRAAIESRTDLGKEKHRGMIRPSKQRFVRGVKWGITQQQEGKERERKGNQKSVHPDVQKV